MSASIIGVYQCPGTQLISFALLDVVAFLTSGQKNDSGMHRFVFDLWYLFRPPWDSRVPPPELVSYISSHPTGAALELGCGTGTNIITLERSGWHVTGVDFSAVAIRRAQRRIRQAGCTATLLVADVSRPLLLAGSYDLALDIGCFHAILRPEAYLQNLTRLLRPGGDWLIYGFIRDAGAQSGFGLSMDDIDGLSDWGLRLLDRRDGHYGSRRSAWFLFERTATPDPRATHRNPHGD